MNHEMLQKLNDLFSSGKITLGQKELLEKALEQKKVDDSQPLEITSLLEIDQKELYIKLLDEDLQMKGDDNTTQVGIIQGSSLVDVTKSENKIIIQSKKENKTFFGSIFGKQDNTELVVVIPSWMSSRVKTVSGDIQITNFSTNMVIKSVSGDIEIDQLNGNLNAQSISGDIGLKSFKGSLEIASKSGDIKIEDSTIHGVMKTYSGDINIRGSKAINLDVSDFSGDVMIDNTYADQNLLCKTFSGDIDIKLNNLTGYIVGSSTSGEIKLVQNNNSQIDLISQTYGDKSNSLQVQIKTTSGDGKIRFTND